MSVTDEMFAPVFKEINEFMQKFNKKPDTYAIAKMAYLKGHTQGAKTGADFALKFPELVRRSK